MIAPLRPPETTTGRMSRRLHQARDLVASTFLRQPSPDLGPPIAAWKAWTFVVWLVIVTAAFAASMLG